MNYYVIIPIVLILLLIIWILATYNKLVKLRNKVKDQWSQVDVYLKKRFDLIPNIVEVVKGYAKHEQDTLSNVIELRTSAISKTIPKEELSENDKLTKALKNLLILSEDYPGLKANENFRDLQENLKDIEDKIAYARQFYNDSVLKYKDAIEMFPTVLVASLLGFKSENFFEAKSNEKENVDVKI